MFYFLDFGQVTAKGTGLHRAVIFSLFTIHPGLHRPVLLLGPCPCCTGL